MEKINKWKEIVEYINTHKNFTRKDLKRDMAEFSGSFDQYVLVLKNIGFLYKPKDATYIRLLKIPEKLSSSKAINLAYRSSFEKEKEKLLTTLKRKEKLLNIENSPIE